MRRLVGLALLSAALLVASGGDARAADWQRVAAWEGTGIRNTETFTIMGSQWQVGWNGAGGNPGVLQIMIYREDGTLTGLAANQANEDPMTGQSIQRGAGNYYLTINSASVNWTVTVDDFR